MHMALPEEIRSREAPILMDWLTGQLTGSALETRLTRVRDLESIFADRAAWQAMDMDRIVYRVEYWRPVPDNTSGGLFWGATFIQPGRVGDEYFMSKCHFHRRRDCSEFYAVIQGEGFLLLMDDRRRTTAQPMRPGSVHYIPGYTAHRVVNTGTVPVAFVACWSSEAGHDYAAILENGFSARLVDRGGRPVLIPAGR